MIEHFKAKKEFINQLEVEKGRKVICPSCKGYFAKDTLEVNNHVCSCGYNFPLSPEKRINTIADEGTFEPIKIPNVDINPINFPDYLEKKKNLSRKLKTIEAIQAGHAKIDDQNCILVVMDSRYIMGSMGIYVGEMIVKAIQLAIETKNPLIIFTASGGARMQEGIHSLMQMAKIGAKLSQLDKAKVPYISVITDPTFGGVTASFALQGDFNFAEKGSRLGFAGRRVIEQTINKELPSDFQTAEFNLKNGYIDGVLKRHRIKEKLSEVLRLFNNRGEVNE